MTSPAESRLALLRNADFTRYLTARFLGSIAVQMQTVAVGWQVYEVTRKPLDLGLIGLSQFLPFVLLILPAGHFADSHDRRRILLGCYGLMLVCSLLLLVFAHHGLESAWPVFGVMILFGVARAFAMPASQAMLPNLVASRAFRHGRCTQFLAVAIDDHRRAGAGRPVVPGRRHDRTMPSSRAALAVSVAADVYAAATHPGRRRPRPRKWT